MKTTNWAIDPSHSEIKFKVKHLMISNVTGSFGKFNAAIETSNEDFSDAKITFSADASSVNTGMEMRDAHLKGDDFFNSELFPELKFESTQVKKTTGSKYLVEGFLTIRDITKNIKLDVEYLGLALDPYGQTKTGWEIKGSINRKDFNLKWSAVTEAGSMVVSDEVKIDCTVQMVKQTLAEKAVA